MRDRDVRNAIKDALLATGAFDVVSVAGKPEDYGQGSSLAALAVIEPGDSSQRDEWDAQTGGALIVTSRVKITLYARLEDPQLRDEAAELLVDVVANALNGSSLAGLTMPAWTRVQSWAWAQPAPPERSIAVTFSYQYIVEGWDSYDTTP